MRESVPLIDGNGVRDPVAGVEDAPGGTAGSVKGENGLDVDVHGGNVEGLEHNLGHALPVGLGVQRGLSEEDGVLLRGATELVVKGVVPDLLHVVPVGDDPVLDGVLEGEDTTLDLGLVSDVSVLLVHADHDTGVLRASDNRGEDGAGGIVSGESGLREGWGGRSFGLVIGEGEGNGRKQSAADLVADALDRQDIRGAMRVCQEEERRRGATDIPSR